MADETKWILPRDENVPHPYNSKLRIKKEGEEMRVCGQVRRLARRQQVTILDAKPEPEKKPAPAKGSDDTPETPKKEKETKKKTARKTVAGHQSKPVSSD